MFGSMIAFGKGEFLHATGGYLEVHTFRASRLLTG
jgi:hypothetical protein